MYGPGRERVCELPGGRRSRRRRPALGARARSAVFKPVARSQSGNRTL
jgi:hypothetical protein